jgi:hypothetical protein
MKLKITMTTNERLERIEKLLLLLIPRRKVPEELMLLDLKPDENERVTVFKRELAKLIDLDRPARMAARFPTEAIPELDLGGECSKLERVPLSMLASRCGARKCFKRVLGEASVKQNVIDVANDLGYLVATLDECGLRKGSSLELLLSKHEFAKVVGGAYAEVLEVEPETTVNVVDVPAKITYNIDEPLPPADFPPDSAWEEDEVTEIEVYREPQTPVVKGLDIKVKKIYEK